MSTLRAAAVLPSKDSRCRPPVRGTGDKIYHTVDSSTDFSLHPPWWNFKEAADEKRREESRSRWRTTGGREGTARQGTMLGIGSVRLVRGKNLGLLAFGRRTGPGGSSSSGGAGGSPRSGQSGMHVRGVPPTPPRAGRGRRRGAVRRRRAHARRWPAGLVGDAPARCGPEEWMVSFVSFGVLGDEWFRAIPASTLLLLWSDSPAMGLVERQGPLVERRLLAVHDHGASFYHRILSSVYVRASF
jgi:hypothetical protein